MNFDDEYIYFTSDLVLSFLLSEPDLDLETGLYFKGEMEIDDYTSMITDKKVEIDGLMETKKTYLKVMEMRELNEEEMKYANKAKMFLAKIFEILFYNKKFMIAWSAVVWTALGINIANGDFLGVLLKSICILFINRPIKFIKEVVNMFKSGKRKEELEEFLKEKHVLEYVDSVDDKKGIRMYAKVREGN